jgi:hypothetical protein
MNLSEPKRLCSYALLGVSSAASLHYCLRDQSNHASIGTQNREPFQDLAALLPRGNRLTSGRCQRIVELIPAKFLLEID